MAYVSGVRSSDLPCGEVNTTVIKTRVPFPGKEFVQ